MTDVVTAPAEDLATYDPLLRSARGDRMQIRETLGFRADAWNRRGAADRLTLQ
ncbi:hypothetical protein ABZ820_05180 [Streptomyces diacarni]|uniref:hypothetical protein n=1 Tax=Streptomyces diacarni TaxID=2800381 RepID=UPI0033DDB14E